MSTSSEETFEELLEEEFSEKENSEASTKCCTMAQDGGAYETKSNKSKELKSTAITFFFFGVLGLVFVLLNVFGIINIINGPLPFIVMSAMFLGFIYIGINSLSRAKKASEESVQEEQITKQINDFLNASVKESTIKAMKDPSLYDEAK